MNEKVEFDVILEINESEKRKQFDKEIKELTKSIEEYRPIISEIIDYYIKYTGTNTTKLFMLDTLTDWFKSEPIKVKKYLDKEYDSILDYINRKTRR